VKLLLDHNLSHKLISRLADIYPDSTQTRLLGFARAVDPEIWFHAVRMISSATAAAPLLKVCCVETSM
jgi:predicted nuclease of predicted toxin-antitoxin system